MKRKAPVHTSSQGTRIMDISGHDLSMACSNEFYGSFFKQQSAKVGYDADVESLDVSRCRLGPRGTSCMLEYLSDTKSLFTRLKRLYLQRNAIGSEGGRAIGKFLASGARNIELLDISLNDIKAGGGVPTAAKLISDALLKNKSLTVLVLDKCAVGPEGAEEIARALTYNKSIARLDLAGNMIGPLGGKSIFAALKGNSSLRELGLKMNRIGGCSDKSDVQTLSDSLAGSTCHLSKLDLSYNDLRCEGCTILSQALLAKSCTLAELILEKNDIGKYGSMEMANALCMNKTLQRLDLKGNKIGNDGAIAFGMMLSKNTVIKFIDLSSCSVGNKGGAALGIGLGQNSSLEHMIVENNSLGDGIDHTLFAGLAINTTLKKVQLKGNGFTSNDIWDKAISESLVRNPVLSYVDLSNNALSDQSIIDAVAATNSTIQYFDVSDNNFQHISIETQLLLSKRTTLAMDLSLNPLSSPPLGRLATPCNLQSYLKLLANEKTEVTRIRLMVCGYGGVGKSTFCRLWKQDLNDFQSSLLPVADWQTDRLIDWAKCLGTTWALDAAKLISDQRISGKDLLLYIDESSTNGNALPSRLLQDLCCSKYQAIDCNIFAKAAYALYQKGYLSTVGAVKVDGEIKLGNRRRCSMVDFAGQVEFLVTHQLLLASMHTLCMIIQPAPSFDNPEHRYFGSWNYWSQFLASLGDRRRGSLLLAVSQLDKVCSNDAEQSIGSAAKEFDDIKARSSGAISMSRPCLLDYNPDNILDTVATVEDALSKSLDQVSQSWWVPESYDFVSLILVDVAKRKEAAHELPILIIDDLLMEIDRFCTENPGKSRFLSNIKKDRTLLQKTIAYLDAVGDVMKAGDFLLLDPVSWFSGFLAHFVKDDLVCTNVQAENLRRQRGTVKLDEIVKALGHDYHKPQEHVSQIMDLLCGLEICVSLSEDKSSYLFPCLLPPLAGPSELSSCDFYHSDPICLRGHRFREHTGFIPPGLFVGLLARLYRKTKAGTMHPFRTWNDHTVLIFNNNATQVLIKLDTENATIDVVGWASESEQLFVGAAKGQACVVTWISHWIQMYLLQYSQLIFQESRLCPNPKCFGVWEDGTKVPCNYTGSEFLLSFNNRHARSKVFCQHDCDVEGCWRFLGGGHSLQKTTLQSGGIGVCQACHTEPRFALRDRVE